MQHRSVTGERYTRRRENRALGLTRTRELGTAKSVIRAYNKLASGRLLLRRSLLENLFKSRD